jgi:hypothetical protein
MATTETTAMTFINPETGEMVEINLDNADMPTQADVREAVSLMDIPGVFAIVDAQFAKGVTFEDEYALVMCLTSDRKMVMAKSASGEIVGALRRMKAHGLATPASPAIVKVGIAKTSGGTTVHKLQMPTPAEAVGFKMAGK